MSMWLQVLIALISAGTLGGIVHVIFSLGRLVERVQSLDNRVTLIDTEGCRRACEGAK